MKLWRRTHKKYRVQAALTTQFRNAKHPHINLIGLLAGKVQEVPVHS